MGTPSFYLGSVTPTEPWADISGGFFFGYNAGLVGIQANEEVQLEDGTILQRGDRERWLAQLITIRPFLT